MLTSFVSLSPSAINPHVSVLILDKAYLRILAPGQAWSRGDALGDRGRGREQTHEWMKLIQPTREGRPPAQGRGGTPGRVTGAKPLSYMKGDPVPGRAHPE